MGLGISNFNFKDISMNRSRTDYFSLKPVRGSSPTSCLTADLSQNFHIDKRYEKTANVELSKKKLTLDSPQLATPRRSLFTTNMFGTLNGRGLLMGNHKENVGLQLNR
jgi:M-phase inducer tyrosine phosphatase